MILQPKAVTAKSHCKGSLQSPAAKDCCKGLFQRTAAKDCCKASKHRKHTFKAQNAQEACIHSTHLQKTFGTILRSNHPHFSSTHSQHTFTANLHNNHSQPTFASHIHVTPLQQPTVAALTSRRTHCHRTHCRRRVSVAMDRIVTAASTSATTTTVTRPSSTAPPHRHRCRHRHVRLPSSLLHCAVHSARPHHSDRINRRHVRLLRRQRRTHQTQQQRQPHVRYPHSARATSALVRTLSHRHARTLFLTHFLGLCDFCFVLCSVRRWLHHSRPPLQQHHRQHQPLRPPLHPSLHPHPLLSTNSSLPSIDWAFQSGTRKRLRAPRQQPQHQPQQRPIISSSRAQTTIGWCRKRPSSPNCCTSRLCVLQPSHNRILQSPARAITASAEVANPVKTTIVSAGTRTSSVTTSVHAKANAVTPSLLVPSFHSPPLFTFPLFLPPCTTITSILMSNQLSRASNCSSSPSNSSFPSCFSRSTRQPSPCIVP